VSQENVEIVRQMWEAFLGDDPASGLLFCDPDIEWDGTNLPDAKVARGHEAIVEHAMRWAEMWDQWRMEPERLIDAGRDRE
jgi:ketosteroid isomerase-like protein